MWPNQISTLSLEQIELLMLLTLAFHFKTIKWILPTAYFVTTLPTYFLYWIFIRISTLPIRRKFRIDLENYLFELYSKQFVYYIFRHSASNVISSVPPVLSLLTKIWIIFFVVWIDLLIWGRRFLSNESKCDFNK